MADQTYPQSEKLSVEGSNWGTLNEFMEFLGSKGIQLHVWAEHDYDEPCTGSIMTDCDGGKEVSFGRTTTHDCTVCHGTGRKNVHTQGWESPSTSQQNLIYEFLDVDPKALEAERRDMLASL